MGKDISNEFRANAQEALHTTLAKLGIGIKEFVHDDEKLNLVVNVGYDSLPFPVRLVLPKNKFQDIVLTLRHQFLEEQERDVSSQIAQPVGAIVTVPTANKRPQQLTSVMEELDKATKGLTGMTEEILKKTTMKRRVSSGLVLSILEGSDRPEWEAAPLTTEVRAIQEQALVTYKYWKSLIDSAIAATTTTADVAAKTVKIVLVGALAFLPPDRSLSAFISGQFRSKTGDMDEIAMNIRNDIFNLFDSVSKLPTAQGPKNLMLIPDTATILSKPSIESWGIKPIPTVLTILPKVNEELERIRNDAGAEAKETAKEILAQFKVFSKAGDSLKGVAVNGTLTFREIAPETNLTPAGSSALRSLMAQLTSPNTDNTNMFLAGALKIKWNHLNSQVVVVTSDRNLQHEARQLELQVLDAEDLEEMFA